MKCLLMSSARFSIQFQLNLDYQKSNNFTIVIVQLLSHLANNAGKQSKETTFVGNSIIYYLHQSFLVQFGSVTQSCPTLCNPMNCSMPGLPVHHQLPESTQTHFHEVHDTIQPSHPLSSPSPPALNLSQHQGFFKWVSSSHQVAKVLEFQLQNQSFQWIFRTDFL